MMKSVRERQESTVLETIPIYRVSFTWYTGTGITNIRLNVEAPDRILALVIAFDKIKILGVGDPDKFSVISMG